MSVLKYRYGHYYVGSGSFLFTGRKLDDGRQELRYFAPREVARIMSFPDEFCKLAIRYVDELCVCVYCI